MIANTTPVKRDVQLTILLEECRIVRNRKLESTTRFMKCCCGILQIGEFDGYVKRFWTPLIDNKNSRYHGRTPDIFGEFFPE